MKRKKKCWLLIVTLLVVSMLLSGCRGSVPTEEQNATESNTQAVQTEEAKLPRFIAVEQGNLGDATYTLFVETTTRVVWIKVREYTATGYGAGLGVVFEPMIDLEGKPLIYTGELTAKK